MDTKENFNMNRGIENSLDIKHRRGGVSDNRESSPLFIKTSFSQKHRINSEYNVNCNKRKERASGFLERDKRELSKGGILINDSSQEKAEDEEDTRKVNDLVSKISNLNNEERTMLDQILNKVGDKKNNRFYESYYKRHGSNSGGNTTAGRHHGNRNNVSTEFFKMTSKNPEVNNVTTNEAVDRHRNSPVTESAKSPLKNEGSKNHYISFSNKPS